MSEENRINQGYVIIDSITVKNVEFVLGEHPTAPSRYVTWECKDGNNYYWGHYMSDKFAAKRDLHKRVESEVSYLRSIGTMPPVSVKHDHER